MIRDIKAYEKEIENNKIFTLIPGQSNNEKDAFKDLFKIFNLCVNAGFTKEEALKIIMGTIALQIKNNEK